MYFDCIFRVPPQFFYSKILFNPFEKVKITALTSGEIVSLGERLSLNGSKHRSEFTPVNMQGVSKPFGAFMSIDNHFVQNYVTPYGVTFKVWETEVLLTCIP
jgi:hypothetical protein